MSYAFKTQGVGIPTAVCAVGGVEDAHYSTAGYSMDGLVLWLDCRRPRRNGSRPGYSTKWEDLSGNGYDVTFCAPVYMNGGVYLDITNITGASDIPLDNDYVVELVTNPAYRNELWLYNKDVFHNLNGTSYGSGCLSFQTKSETNYIYRCGARGHAYQLRNLTSHVTAGQRAAFHLGNTPSMVYINGVPKQAVSAADGYFGMGNTDYVINAHADNMNKDVTTHISALRIYSRSLTEDEILRHCKLDIMRFELST